MQEKSTMLSTSHAHTHACTPMYMYAPSLWHTVVFFAEASKNFRNLSYMVKARFDLVLSDRILSPFRRKFFQSKIFAASLSDDGSEQEPPWSCTPASLDSV
jgi:hypothetical protein